MMSASIFSRKKFLALTSAGLAGIVGQGLAQQSQTEKPPALDKDLVKDFVIAGHGNFDKVKQMLQEHATLLYATWDWGGGDFETALEGAGHVGNKEIANYLIGLGARTNLFVLTMLGENKNCKTFLNTVSRFCFCQRATWFNIIAPCTKRGRRCKGVA